MLTDEDQDRLRERLYQLRVEHRDMDMAIKHLVDGKLATSLELSRMKRNKLKLRDEIERLESLLIPDRPA